MTRFKNILCKCKYIIGATQPLQVLLTTDRVARDALPVLRPSLFLIKPAAKPFGQDPSVSDAGTASSDLTVGKHCSVDNITKKKELIK